MLAVLSPALAEADLLAACACFTPFIGPNETQPTIGAVPAVEGLFVAGGHGVWGNDRREKTGKKDSERQGETFVAMK